MKIFLSHAGKDSALARQLAARLQDHGFRVWISEEQIAPGENWAKKMGKALDNSELMLILLTPAAFESDRIRQDLEFALGSKKYEGRVFSVFVGPTFKAGQDVPWILLKLPHRQVESSDDFGVVVEDIQALGSDSGLSRSNA
jgi:hypothetical protein